MFKRRRFNTSVRVLGELNSRTLKRTVTSQDGKTRQRSPLFLGDFALFSPRPHPSEVNLESSARVLLLSLPRDPNGASDGGSLTAGNLKQEKAAAASSRAEHGTKSPVQTEAHGIMKEQSMPYQQKHSIMTCP
ncbi:unnamed protein product [Closterium sp. Yama58-4]|nr:unnamed protein product [Closterium sp. Yama58-4]